MNTKVNLIDLMPKTATAGVLDLKGYDDAVEEAMEMGPQGVTDKLCRALRIKPAPGLKVYGFLLDDGQGLYAEFNGHGLTFGTTAEMDRYAGKAVAAYAIADFKPKGRDMVSIPDKDFLILGSWPQKAAMLEALADHLVNIGAATRA